VLPRTLALVLLLILLAPTFIYVRTLLSGHYFILIDNPLTTVWLPALLILQEPGVVKIYYASDKPFMVNGKELLGYVLVYFDVSDVRAVLTHRLQERKVISIDFRRDVERSRELWSKVVNELSTLYNGSLRGSIRLPTLGVALMLFDGEGYMYTYTWTFSAFKYNLLVKGMRNHTEALIEALKNPFEFIERGLVLVLDPARFTRANFSIVDINRALKHVKSLVEGERGDISETAVITVSLRSLEELPTTSSPDRFQDIYWYDLYNSRYDPPSWYRSRLTARGGQLDDPVSYSWYVFAWRFSMATNYAKDKYSFRDAFELFFNYDFYFYCPWPNYRSASGDYVYTMLSPDDFVEICLLTGYQVDASWSHTYPPNSLHQVYKPYVIFYRSTKNLTFMINYDIFEASYVKKGLAFFNVLILGREHYSASYFEIVADYRYEFDSPSGYYGGGFIIPAVFLYPGDRVLVTWLPTTRYISGREYWSFIPYPAFIPYHEEVSEDLDNAIRVYLDSSNMIVNCTCATRDGTSSKCSSVNYYCSDLLGRHIWDLIDRLSYQAVGLYESMWSDCSIGTGETVVDDINDPRITVRDPAIVFNVIKDFVAALFGLAGDPATKLIGALLSAFSLADLEFRAVVRDFDLVAMRDYDPCTGEYIVIKKNTYQYALQRGLIPLVAYYYVVDYYPETPPEPIPQP
jgi:hypothetical protein